MKLIPSLLVVPVLLTTLPLASAAQGTRQDYARAERFLRRNLDGLVLNERVAPRFVGETNRFWYTRELADGKEFVVVDPVAASRGPAFDHARLAQGLGAVLGRPLDPRNLPFDDFDFTSAGDAIVVRMDTLHVTCGISDYSCTAEEPPAERPRGMSPDGRWVAFVRDHDLWLRATESGWEIPLTDDGEYGRAYASPLPSPLDMIRQGTEDPEPNVAVFWAPDSKRLVTYRIDARHAGTLSMVQHAPPHQIRPRHYTFWYPLPPDTILPAAEFFIFDVGTQERTAVAVEPLPRQYYGGPRATWSADGREFYIEFIERGYTRQQLLAVDPESGAAHVVVDEPGDPIVNTYADVSHRYVNDGVEVLWASERDGWMHLYLYDGATGRMQRQVTSGEWVVRRIEHIDEQERVVYFSGGGREEGRDPYLQHLYRVKLDGSDLRLLTPENGDHSVTFSPTGRFFVDTYSRADVAPLSVVRRTSDGRVVLELEQADISRLEATGWRFPEPFRALARDGETDIYGIIWRPTTFDPARTYPVVETIYTGPQGFFVPKTFRAWRNHAQTIAELGFVVVQVDGFGTARRSKAFHRYSYKNLGDQGLEDHIAAIRQIAAEYPYMDLTRVGIYGHSAGGYDAAHALLTHPEFYKVGVSSAGNHDHRLDKAVWNTQWMGWPIGPEYEEQSNVTLAGNLEGKLLLAHGDLDNNVPVSATLRLTDALIKADKDFDLIIMTNFNHGFGRSMYFTRRRWDFFVEHLLGVDPPAGYQITESN